MIQKLRDEFLAKIAAGKTDPKACGCFCLCACSCSDGDDGFLYGIDARWDAFNSRSANAQPANPKPD